MKLNSVHSCSFFFLTLGLLTLESCVVSTHGPPGTPPEVPLPPSAQAPVQTQKLIADGPAEVGASHILISYKGAMRAAPYIEREKPEALIFANELLKTIQSGGDFAKLAEENSDDPGSAAKGGSLGKFRREQMVPIFSDTAFALDVGSVSKVVESPFGFHIILRTE